MVHDTPQPAGNRAWVRCKRQMPDGTSPTGPTPNGGTDCQTADGGSTGRLLKAALLGVLDDITGMKWLVAHR